MLSTVLIQPPIVEPVSLIEAKLHLRVDATDDDTLITGLIVGARQYCESYTRRAFFNQQWMRTLDYFPVYASQYRSQSPNDRNNWFYSAGYWDSVTIDLPKTVVSVDSITYVDNDSTTQTLDPATYSVDTTSIPARIAPKLGQFFPVVSNYVPGSVKITFTAGSYGDGVAVNTIPETIKIAMKLLLAHWYQHREASSELQLKNIPLGVDALLDMHRIRVIEYR